MKRDKLKKLVKGVVLTKLNENTLSMMHDDEVENNIASALDKLMGLAQKAPSLLPNLKTLKIEKNGSLWSVVAHDSRGNALPLLGPVDKGTASKVIKPLADRLIAVIRHRK